MERAQYRIQAEGKDITSLIADRFISLVVNDAAGEESDTFTLTLDNRDDLIEFPGTGYKLRIWIGLEGNLMDKGTYTVDEITEGIDDGEIEVTGKAADLKGGKGATIKSQKNRTLKAPNTFASLAALVAKDNGYRAEVHPTCAKVQLGHITQKAESDMNLLTRLSRAHGFMFKVAADTLIIIPKGAAEKPNGKPLPVVDITDPTWSSGRVTLREVGTYAAVSATWFDETSQKAITEVVREEGAEGAEMTLKGRYKSRDEAVAAARASLDNKARGKTTMDLTIPLTPQIVSPGKVRVANHRKAANGVWYVERASHKVGDGFSSTSLSLTTESHDATKKKKARKDELKKAA